jgi:enamine deaminase RidA (YjgF/YER057c/UK114 family)
MEKASKISSGTIWEDIVGYSRAVKIGNIIEISGTTAFDEKGNVIGKNDPYLQTITIIKKAKVVLLSVGASLDDVVRTRMFVTDISKWKDIGKAHGDFFKNIKPAATMVEVVKLIHPDLMVEIEFSAVLNK